LNRRSTREAVFCNEPLSRALCELACGLISCF
jgi:hypothetical protein